MSEAADDAGTPKSPHFHVVELSVVTDETVAETLNAQRAAGRSLVHMYFVTRDASRRPSMAFLIFEPAPC